MLSTWAAGGKERDEARSVFAGLMENQDIFEGPDEVFGMIYFNIKGYEEQYNGDIGMLSKPKSEAAERYLSMMGELTSSPPQRAEIPTAVGGVLPTRFGGFLLLTFVEVHFASSTAVSQPDAYARTRARPRAKTFNAPTTSAFPV